MQYAFTFSDGFYNLKIKFGIQLDSSHIVINDPKINRESMINTFNLIKYQI